MEPSLILLLAGCVALSILLAYFGYFRSRERLSSRSRAGFIFLAFVLIPALSLVLWGQSGAKGRLAAIGVVPHPSLGSAVGIAVGLGRRPAWAFATAAPPESVIAFYGDSAHRAGWRIVEEGPALLVLEREGLRLAIHGHERWRSRVVVFSLTP